MRTIENDNRLEDAMAGSMNTLAQRARRIAEDAIGLPFRVRLDSSTVFSGTIVECEYLGERRRQRTAIAQFRTVIEGPTGFRQTVTVERLPR